MNALFPTSFTEWFYFYDYVDFSHIFEGPQDAVVSTSVAWYDTSNTAIQISTTAESIEWADDVIELAATISQWLMCEAQLSVAAASLRIGFSESPLQLPFFSEPNKSWHKHGAVRGGVNSASNECHWPKCETCSHSQI